MNDMELVTDVPVIEMEMEVVTRNYPVIPNPEGTPTDDISSMEIDNVIYAVKDETARTELENKVDKEAGKGLSEEDFTHTLKTKLDGIENGAEVNVQSDFAQSDNSADDFIKNKPTKLSDFSNDEGFIDNSVNDLENYYKKSETYTKTEINSALDGKADKSDTYTKSEVNSALDNKADKSNTYTKTETDTLLNGKVDKETGKGLSENDFTDALKTDVEESALSVGLINEEAFEWSKVEFEQGYWAIANGTAQDGNAWIRTKENLPLNTREIIIDESTNIVAFVLAYEGSEYKGYWNGQTWTKTYNADDGKQYYNINQLKKIYPTYIFRLSVHRTTGANIPVTDSKYISETYVYPSVINAVKSADDLNIKTNWVRGIITASGNVNSGNGATTDILYNIKNVSLSTKCRAAISLFRDTYYVGKINANGGVDKASGSWKYFYNDIDVDSMMKTYNVNGLRLSLLPLDSATITDSNVTEYANTHFKGLTLNSETIVNKNVNSIGLLDSVSDSLIYSINHRGYCRVAPENTIPAFMLSKIKGFKYVECDVWFTSDGVPVILHDSTINRTARNIDGTEISSTISISNITYAEALEYDYGIWKGEEWAGTKIPTFEEFMILCKRLALKPVIELKDYNWNTTKTNALAVIINSLGMGKACSFISFSKNALLGMTEKFPKSMIGLGYGGDYSVEAVSNAITSATDLETGENEVYLIIDISGMSQSIYELFLTSEIGLFVVGLNNESQIIELNKVVLGVLSDVLNASEVLARQTLFEFLES